VCGRIGRDGVDVQTLALEGDLGAGGVVEMRDDQDAADIRRSRDLSGVARGGGSVEALRVEDDIGVADAF
jgi:hypothetical protein